MTLKALDNVCLQLDGIYQVMQDEDKDFYVMCAAGRHYLSDYIEEDGVNQGIVDFAAVF